MTYSYDTTGRLSTVTDPESNVTTYLYGTTFDPLVRGIRDGRNIQYLTNVYQAAGAQRVISQTLADPNAAFTFNYTEDASNNVTKTDITDPRGYIERLTFNTSHYIVNRTEALGTPLQRTTTFERQPGTNLVTAVVDALNRRTEFTYNSPGHVLTETRLTSTPQAVTTTYTYEPLFGQLASVKDPLNHTWTVTYDSTGQLTGIADPLNHQTTLTLTIVPAGSQASAIR